MSAVVSDLTAACLCDQVGINTDDMESEKVHLGAIIVRDLSITVSNYRSSMTLEQYWCVHSASPWRSWILS